MILELVRTDSGLIPVTDDGVGAVKKMHHGQHVFVEYKPKRNYKFHKKLFALLNAVLPNQAHYKTADNLLEAVKYRAGQYETVFTHKGEQFIKTKSIAFHAMDEFEFEQFFSFAVDVCLELVGEDAVNDILRFI